jgi:hypothetical protein
LTGHISCVFWRHSGDIIPYKHDIADTIGRVGNLKYFGEALRNKDGRVKKLRSYLGGLLTRAS